LFPQNMHRFMQRCFLRTRWDSCNVVSTEYA